MGVRIWACWARRSHRGRCSYGWASRCGFVGAPVTGAIWGGAFGRAGHAVRTGAVRPSGGAPTEKSVVFWVCRSTRVGCEEVQPRVVGACSVRTGAVRRSGGAPTGDDPWVVGAPAPGAKGPASLIILAREFPRPPSLLHPTPP